MGSRKFANLCFMADCSRNASLNLPTIKRLIDILKRAGYNSLMLYTEDTYEVIGEPFFGYMRARFTAKELKEVDCYAKANGMTLIPCIQTLAHLNQIFAWKEYQAINDTGDILLADNERTYKLIDNMIKTCAEVFSSREINIGLDEAAMLGLGKFLKVNGYENSLEIFKRHLNKVLEICKKYGFSPMMWSDMFFRTVYGGEYYDERPSMEQAALSIVPKDTKIIYWDYSSADLSHYDIMFKKHKELFKHKDDCKKGLIFACGAWKWSGFAPDNTYSLHTQNAGLKSAYDNGTQSVIVTSWGDDGAEASVFSALPGIINAAAYNLNIDVKEHFKAVTGCDFNSFMLLDKLNRINDTMLPDELGNFSKCYLYSDPFNGFLDSNVEEGLGKKYEALAKQIRVSAADSDKVGEYKYIFECLADLADVMIYKTELGIRYRKSYQSSDKAALTKVNEDAKKILPALDKFYESFRLQWLKDNKANGFEVQDLRLGGLILRLKSCIRTVEDYLNGRIDKIEELEVKLLDFSNGKFGGKKSNDWFFNKWHLNVTGNII